ncbi:MAG: hypothetical protein E4H14_09915 [Candidatus Thorarchaeota archaeon]|nr:MAG: hypothetical protein E4H14_09915 [Candidatus Thorarchaeota archaeon]
MIRKAAVILFVMLLAMQPLVILTSFAANEVGTLNIDNSSQLAQEAGSRLDPIDYTDHVPILIDQVSDWTSQAWPGSGTSGDPYIISGLRIHYDIGLPLIQVTNQDAYFIVRDCLLIQNSTMYAVEFQNTTHAMVEYSTFYSEGVGIYGNNANNTVLDHIFGEGSGVSESTAYFYESLQVTISNCELNSISCQAILTMYCHDLTLTSNTLEGYITGFDNRYSNYTSCTGMMVTGPDTSTGISADECYYTTFSDIEVQDCGTGFSGTDVDFITLTDSSFYTTYLGIDFLSSLNITVSGCYVSGWDGAAANFDYCYYAIISGNNFTNDDANNALSGVWLQHSDNSTIHSNFFVDFGYTALHIDLSLNVMISNNYFDEVDYFGIYLDLSHYITLTNNEYYRTGYTSGGYTIYVENSDYATIRSEYMDNLFCASIIGQSSDYGLIEDCWLIGSPTWVGVGFFSGNNWTIQDNHIEGNWKALVHFDFGGNLKIYRNTLVDNLYDTTCKMIDFQGPYDLEIINNTLTNCAGHAMSLTSGQRGLVEGNVITNTYQGIYSTIVNVTIIENTLHDITHRGIDAYSSINTEILNNDIDGSEYGLYLNVLTNPLISGNTIENANVGMHYVTVINAIIESNELTNCGFSFQKQQGYGAYNHSMSNNFINGLPLYYSVNSVGLSLDADDYGQIILLNATNSAITNGEIVNATYGIILVVGDNIDITNVALTDHYIGAIFDRAYNVTLEDCVFSDSYFISHMSHDFIVENLTIQGEADSSTITSLHNFQILNSYIKDGANGFSIFSSQDGLIEGNRFFGSNIGVELTGTSQDIEIIDNEFKWCIFGVSGDTTSNINITKNNIHDNLQGVYATYATNWRITNNTFFGNQYTGLWLDHASSPFVVDNIFMNIGNDGWEDASTNYWDDGIDTGNSWYEIPLVSPHPIGGSGGSTDR